MTGDGRAELGDRYDRWHEERLKPAAVSGVDPQEDRFYSWLLGLVRAPAGARLLDVACGQGSFLAYAASRGIEVTGVDISELAVEVARSRVPAATVVVGEGENLPFEDSSFDYVTCIGSLEHFPDPAAGAAEMARVVRPDGQALVFVPNLFFLGHVWFGLRHGAQPSEGGQAFSEIFLSSKGWEELLTKAGFEVQSRHSWNHIFASDRVGSAVKGAWNALSRFVPSHGAYAFAFVCTPRRVTGASLGESAPPA